MSCCLKAGFSVSGSSDFIVKNRAKGSLTICSSLETLELKESNSREIWGKTLDLNVRAPILDPVHVQSSVCVSKALRWWEKHPQPNMVEVQSAQEFVDYLLNAGDRLVVVDFYSPGCGGCKSLHPKISQLAEFNPNAMFLKVNYEEHKAMCYALHVHVLPFFRFYRGAEGKVCSFSCTNATIKKFKDALAKHGADRCSAGPAKGLDESELLALASIGLISRDSVRRDDQVEDLVLEENVFSNMGSKEGNAMVAA